MGVRFLPVCYTTCKAMPSFKNGRGIGAIYNEPMVLLAITLRNMVGQAAGRPGAPKPVSWFGVCLFITETAEPLPLLTQC